MRGVPAGIEDRRVSRVINAVDRRNGGAHLDAARTSQAQLLSRSNDLWMISTSLKGVFGSNSQARANKQGSASPMGLNADFMKAVEQAAVGLRFVPGSVELNMEAMAKTEKDAGALADVVRFLTNMVQLNRDQEETRAFALALDGMLVTQDAKTLRIKLALPQDQLEKIMHGGPAKSTKKI